MTTVLLADDHAVVAEGLAAVIKTSFKLLGTVFDGHALVAAAEQLRPDVIVTDITMPVLNGLDAIRQIRKAQPHAKIVVLTMHPDADMAVQAFRAGALGYVLKISSSEELIAAIHEAAAGRTYLTSSISRGLISVLLEAHRKPAEPSAQLSPRRREVLQLIAEGRTMKEVAAILGISQRTAEAHKAQIKELLGAESTAELIQYAIRLKLIGG
jgi:DNA-binding NarL/FixJ family response regulator